MRANQSAGTNVFNARDLKSKELAARFIAPAAFSSLLGDYNCVLEGPRGSGKTTLLRMLTPDAYAAWASSQAGKEADSIGFIGVFVPADVRWSKQLESRLSTLSEADKQVFMESAFSVATSLALVEAIDGCSRGSAELSERYPDLFFSIDRYIEENLVRQLSAMWGLSPRVPSISGIKLALRSRQHELGLLASLASSGRDMSALLSENPYLGSSWLHNLTSAVETANEVTGRVEQRWAILLDELEIVPKQIINCVVQSLRTTSALVKFKIALSPAGIDLDFSGDTTAPSPENDYRPIPLWYETRREARAFSEKLFNAALENDLSIGEGSASKRLGLNWMGSSTDEGGAPEESPTEQMKKFRVEAFLSLYKKDSSFRRILDRRGIDPSSPPLSDETDNGNFVRKVTPLVCMRDREVEFFDESGVKKKGGRKSRAAYLGYPNMLDLTEGNPRWVLTLANMLQSKSELQSLPISSPGVQSSAVNDFTDQYVSKLTVYPTGYVGGGRKWTLMAFIEKLGESLSASLYSAEFNSDPALSFSIDEESLDSYGRYIRLCIDLGALVLVRGGASAPLGGDPGAGSLLNQRVRLSYRLAPKFQLPFRATKSKRLISALRAGASNAHSQIGPPRGSEGSGVPSGTQGILL